MTFPPSNTSSLLPTIHKSIPQLPVNHGGHCVHKVQGVVMQGRAEGPGGNV